MKKIVFVLSALVTLSVAGYTLASEGKPLRHIDWAFDGIFGTVDKQSAQRGFQIYKEVCSACHGLKRVAFRNLEDIGFSEGEIKALAAGYQIHDGPNDAGDMFDRPGKPSDYFPSPFANDNAARASNGGALPPDLSLIIKARNGGGDYVYSILNGYGEPPADIHMNEGMHYNAYFPGNQIAMPQPLTDDRVSYSDGTKATLDQEARDVVTFLEWASEPEMEARKEMGIKVMVFLFIFTAFAYIAKRNLWRKLH